MVEKVAEVCPFLLQNILIASLEAEFILVQMEC